MEGNSNTMLLVTNNPNFKTFNKFSSSIHNQGWWWAVKTWVRLISKWNNRSRWRTKANEDNCHSDNWCFKWQRCVWKLYAEIWVWVYLKEYSERKNTFTIKEVSFESNVGSRIRLICEDKRLSLSFSYSWYEWTSIRKVTYQHTECKRFHADIKWKATSFVHWSSHQLIRRASNEW
jgi:hypothetical protein